MNNENVYFEKCQEFENFPYVSGLALPDLSPVVFTQESRVGRATREA